MKVVRGICIFVLCSASLAGADTVTCEIRGKDGKVLSQSAEIIGPKTEMKIREQGTSFTYVLLGDRQILESENGYSVQAAVQLGKGVVGTVASNGATASIVCSLSAPNLLGPIGSAVSGLVQQQSLESYLSLIKTSGSSSVACYFGGQVDQIMTTAKPAVDNLAQHYRYAREVRRTFADANEDIVKECLSGSPNLERVIASADRLMGATRALNRLFFDPNPVQ